MRGRRGATMCCGLRLWVYSSLWCLVVEEKQRFPDFSSHCCCEQGCLNEATFTSLARIAAAKENPDMGVWNCAEVEALFGFCEKVMADKAYEVDADMVEFGVVAAEAELSAIFKS
ncbi:hypothetical protein CMV_016653 [Castanea mollissima]|uniref:Uncharacterized protein n=1 Tax=Castanea mollissima TaxID=60419 RepID=A0A8J4QU55_9ROSI|nr:hypothetical protein CMV_016653 [Castanea mollissima]